MANITQTGEKPRTVAAACFGGHRATDFIFDAADNALSLSTDKETLTVDARSFARFLRGCGTNAGEWEQRPFMEQCRVFYRYLEEQNAALERRYYRLFSLDAD